MSLRWSEKDLAAHQARRGAKVSSGGPNQPACDPAPSRSGGGSGHLALGRLPAGAMNKTEAAYDAYLWQLRHAGEVLWHKFEGVKLRLADNTFLTVDFAVLPKDGILRMMEVKGFMRDDAAVKLKVAAAIYPFRFFIVRKKGGGWEETEI